MDYKTLHDWNVSGEEAKNIQLQLAGLVSQTPLPDDYLFNLKYVAGCDISFNPGSDVFYAGIVVVSWPDGKLVDQSVVKTKGTFPYIPGLLSFRESPPLLEAWKNLQTKPDIVVMDGHGISHPRGLGIASHFGLLIDTPTIGCAKKLLCGSYKELGYNSGAQSNILLSNKIVGKAIRSRANELPIFVSVGSGLSLDNAVDVVTSLCKGFRLPATTRLAHDLVNRFRKGLPL